MSRNLLLPVLLTGVLGIPVIMMNDNSQSNSSVIQGLNGDPANAAAMQAAHSNTVGDPLGTEFASLPIEFTPVSDLRQIFRFDLTPGMISQRWERVALVGDEIGLRGMRIAFASGTAAWDIHGSLTFYFDNRNELQRISFRGWTGDATQIISLLQEQFEFQANRSLDAGCYSRKSWGKLRGVCLLRHPNVIRSDLPLQKLAIFLEVTNPTGNYSVSKEAERHWNEAQYVSMASDFDRRSH